MLAASVAILTLTKGESHWIDTSALTAPQTPSLGHVALLAAHPLGPHPGLLSSVTFGQDLRFGDSMVKFGKH